MTEYKIGDTVRIIDVSAIDYGDEYFFDGMITKVLNIDDNSDIYLRGKDGGEGVYIAVSERHAIELVTYDSEPTPVEASPTVIELLANISRRLYEAEQTIKSQAYEINELYKADAERAVADRG